MDVTIMRNFTKLANLHRVFFKRAEGSAPMPAGGRRPITPAQRQDADDIINGFNDLKKPVDPKALMAERAVHRYEPTFQANRPAKPQLSDKDISGMQSAFGGKQPQKPLPGAGGQQNTPPIPRK